MDLARETTAWGILVFTTSYLSTHDVGVYMYVAMVVIGLVSIFAVMTMFREPRKVGREVGVEMYREMVEDKMARLAKEGNE